MLTPICIYLHVYVLVCLQLEVVASRMSTEYGVDVTFERVSYTGARWALAGWDAVDEASTAGKLLNIRKLSDVWGRPVLLFPSEWRLNSAAAQLGDELKLRPHALACVPWQCAWTCSWKQAWALTTNQHSHALAGPTSKFVVGRSKVARRV